MVPLSFGFVQNQTVDNNSSLDTLETTSDYCVSSFLYQLTLLLIDVSQYWHYPLEEVLI